MKQARNSSQNNYDFKEILICNYYQTECLENIHLNTYCSLKLSDFYFQHNILRYTMFIVKFFCSLDIKIRNILK